MPRLTIDGQPVEVPAGTTVLQAALGIRKEVPYYCWHPGLSVSGNCRICLVEVERMRGVQIACNLPCAEGMVVHTESEAAKKARADVMELLLINHPLDCPICDQAGECKLQEYSFELGKKSSRFDVPKNHKRKHIDFSDKVVFDAERCIVCTRCVRFCQEVAREDELAVVQRGDRSEIDVAPGKTLSNPYSMNVIDICPVGALTSTDFRFRSRVWFMEQKRTACASCARGCNVLAGTRWNRVLRLVPAENEAVNRWWMCDYGRLNYKDVASEDRLAVPMIQRDGKPGEAEWEEALGILAGALSEAKGGGAAQLFGLVSARLTNEECWLARRLLGDLVGSPNLDLKPRAGEADGFLLAADRNPNANGARAAGIAPRPGGFGLDGFAAAAASRKVNWAILVGDDLDDRPEDLEALSKVPFVAVIGSHLTETAKRATVVLPGGTWAEKDGTITNMNRRVQRLRAAVRPPGEARPESRILAALLDRLDPARAPTPSAPGGLFRAMAAGCEAFRGLTLEAVGDEGAQLPGTESPPAPVHARHAGAKA